MLQSLGCDFVRPPHVRLNLVHSAEAKTSSSKKARECLQSWQDSDVTDEQCKGGLSCTLLYALYLFLDVEGIDAAINGSSAAEGKTALGLNFEHALLGQTRPSICFWSAAGNAVPSAHKGTQNHALSP